MWTGLGWGPWAVRCETWYWTFEFSKRWEIFGLVEWLFASQGLHCMKLAKFSFPFRKEEEEITRSEVGGVGRICHSYMFFQISNCRQAVWGCSLSRWSQMSFLHVSWWFLLTKSCSWIPQFKIWFTDWPSGRYSWARPLWSKMTAMRLWYLIAFAVLFLGAASRDEVA